MVGERRSARRPGAKVSRLRRKMLQISPPRRRVPPAETPRRGHRPAGGAVRAAAGREREPIAPVVRDGLRATPLREEHLRSGAVSLERWEPQLVYRWDTGLAIGRFLDGLRAGKILGVRCDRCHRTVTPPRAFCEWCFKPVDAWVELADTGTINTFSICTVTWDMQPLAVPQVPAVIEIDGTQPRVGFLHLIGGLNAQTVEGIRQEVRVGQRVRAVWKSEAQRSGAITDILYFTPV
ncbi:MAG: Zn-ribbon domain-containing OB-fold protein [Armatimonadota bacterium]|nr:Zn-ribbon domain-containing OB-fold protein [Armatimonadota bacterium]MDR7427120.1 Zn-ribbon domain-containing OB-fold protein [Armatimonadota bacterium]MDR7464201.1 Zn-ribbon domain-containing OB-fold protein [Armatimonadota bacterium]MDR7470010.1 Zn-ribbon domain-containing OB-fold protein [Armatimonadota bacterium]MDR7474112.1 Zn-ribbon domain-containing OB-fold protein [Armatimonadota bacterium]